MSKIAFIFPGQGAQITAAWDRISIEQTKEGKETFDLATDILGILRSGALLYGE